MAHSLQKKQLSTLRASVTIMRHIPSTTLLYRAYIYLVGFVLALTLPLGMPSARAQASLRVVSMPVPEYTFGEGPTFQVNLASDSPIIAVALNLRTPELNWTVSDTARFTAGTQITAAYTLQLGTRQIQPFSPVESWWEVRDQAGNFLETPHQTFVYSDTRFQWQSLSDERITVWWYDGDRAFGRTALEIANNGLARANRDLLAPLPQKLDIYLYANDSDARLALTATDRLWASGHANPMFGVVVVTVPPDDIETVTRLGREIPHELTHILVYQAIGDWERFVKVPHWLNEGLAVTNQSSPDPSVEATLSSARQTGNLLPVAALCVPFPNDPAQAQLAYAQSESLVRYIRDRFGSRSLSNLIETYKNGQNCESGVQTALGISLSELEQRWLEEAVSVSSSNAPSESEWLPLLVIGAILIIIAPFGFSIMVYRPRRPVTRVV
jgi:hypothetical protein